MSLAELTAHQTETEALAQAAGLIGWDQEAMMPPAGAAQRAEIAAALAKTLQERRSDPRIPEWIAAIDDAALTPFERRNVEEAARAHARATKVPGDLASALARAASEGHVVWAAAREAGRFADFAPQLTRILELKREEAAALSEGADSGGDPYDALLDWFEPGAKAATLGPMLEAMRPRLSALSAAIRERPVPAALTGSFPADAQLALARKVAARIGYDFDGGRIDTVTHPFCSGVGGDVRITTRTDEADPLNCLYSTIHEVGHALYAQGTPDPFAPAAQYASMGAHESQSRFWENQVARSRPFMAWLRPAMAAAFGDDLIPDPDALYAAVNRVQPGFIRTEADEVHYNLHILLRFELERELIAGTLGVEDLEAEWNRRFARDFGETPPGAALGVLQDVHWSAGLFGYFPTYSVGNIYAACLTRALRRDLPDFDAMVAAAETQPILDWLRAKIHVRGRMIPARDLIEEATGEAPSAEPLLDYVEAKFGALYDL